MGFRCGGGHVGDLLGVSVFGCLGGFEVVLLIERHSSIVVDWLDDWVITAGE